MPEKILFINTDNDDKKTSELVVRNQIDYIQVNDVAEGIKEIGKNGFNLAILNLNVLDERLTTQSVKLHKFLPQLPLFVLARQISIFAYRQIGPLDNFVTLQKPYQEEMFDSIISRIILEKSVRPSLLPRFVTDEPARMMVLRTGLLVTTRMKNYSAGGAFLQYNGISVKVGDKIQLNFETSNVKPTASIRGEVRWITDGTRPQSPTRGVGVKFTEISTFV